MRRVRADFAGGDIDCSVGRLTIVGSFNIWRCIRGIGAAVIGNVVSQRVGLATGIQAKFNFKGVAMADISGM